MPTNTEFNQDRFLRSKDVRHHFSISDPTLHRWVKSGKLPKPQYLNSQRVWRQSAIEAAEDQMLASGERVETRLEGGA